MKKFLALILIIIALGGASFYWWNLSVKPVSNSEEVRDFLITKGASASYIGNKLQGEGFIRNSLAFRLYVQLTNRAGRIQSGEYSLSSNLSLVDIVNELLRGPREVWITIPEGLRREEIAERFAVGLQKEQKEVFVDQFLEASLGKEGSLFPDTYIFPKTASASVIVNKMLSTFNDRIDSQMEQDIEASGYSLNQILTMAAIVERETISKEERPIVAGILFKRLRADWPLQADATLQYLVADKNCGGVNLGCDWWEIPTNEDKKLNSPFNTYRNPGLPPAPIANPGLLSIKAAIYAEESDYWYYLHDAKGKIYYAETLEGHNENIQKYIAN